MMPGSHITDGICTFAFEWTLIYMHIWGLDNRIMYPRTCRGMPNSMQIYEVPIYMGMHPSI